MSQQTCKELGIISKSFPFSSVQNPVHEPSTTSAAFSKLSSNHADSLTAQYNKHTPVFDEFDKTATGSTRRLHVSNIPFHFNKADLLTMFAKFGSISDAEVVYNHKGSKGYGFVTFKELQSATRSKNMLDGTLVEGRRITVNDAIARATSRGLPHLPTCEIQTPCAVSYNSGYSDNRYLQRFAVPVYVAPFPSLVNCTNNHNISYPEQYVGPMVYSYNNNNQIMY